MLRENETFFHFGDYLLLDVAAEEIMKAGYPIRRSSLLRVMRESEEMSWMPIRDRVSLVDQILDPSLALSEVKSNLIKRLKKSATW